MPKEQNPFEIDFDTYIFQSEPSKQEKGKLWQTAIVLQQVDGLTPSKYLMLFLLLFGVLAASYLFGNPMSGGNAQQLKQAIRNIPEDAQEHIYERFYRVDKSHSREIGGTGLGLAITRNAIIMHRGAIKVFSVEGEGTTFTVRIPLNYIE